MNERRHQIDVEVCDEIERADAKYGPFTSTHEGYGVIAEEVAELLDAIRSNELHGVAREAMQVAAVAMRLAEACRQAIEDDRAGKPSAFATRSGAW